MPVRIGIIGAGGMARAHMRQLFQIPGVSITALCDTNPAAFEKAKAQHPEQFETVFTTADYAELLARDDVDAVIIATPHTLHTEHGMAAIEAGKHTLIEKPMVCSVPDAHTILERLKSFDKIFALAYQRHAQGPFRYMQQQISSGEMGAVTFISALQCQGWKKGTAGSWRQDLGLSGGGQINDSGSHLLDILLWVTGLTVAEVAAFMDNMGTPVDINSALAFRFHQRRSGNDQRSRRCPHLARGHHDLVRERCLLLPQRIARSLRRGRQAHQNGIGRSAVRPEHRRELHRRDSRRGRHCRAADLRPADHRTHRGRLALGGRWRQTR